MDGTTNENQPPKTENTNDSEPKKKFLKFFWTTIWVSLGLIIGLVPVWIYSYSKNFGIGLSLLWSFAYFAAGALAGFIFAVPKIINSVPAETSSQRFRKIIEENTNLTQISDWLTKVIIGVGLVELKEIPPFIMKVARSMGSGISNLQSDSSAATLFSASIILFFSVWGFICGYLIMRIVITDILADIE